MIGRQGEMLIGQEQRDMEPVCVCMCVCYMFGHGGVCVQSEASGVLWQVGGVRVDQSPAPPVPLSQPDLLSKTDPAPDTHHYHTANHRHAHTLQPIKILRMAVVGVDHAPLQREAGEENWHHGYHGDKHFLSLCLTVVLPVALYGQ